MKEEVMRAELKTFEGLIRVLKALESRLTDLEKQVKRHYAWINELGDRLTEHGG